MAERGYLDLLDEIWRTLRESRPSGPEPRNVAGAPDTPAAAGDVDPGVEQLEFPLLSARRGGGGAERPTDLPVEELLGGWVGHASVRALREAGYVTVSQIVLARPEDLDQVHLIGPHRTQQLKTRAVLALHRAGGRAGDALQPAAPAEDPMSMAIAGLAVAPRLRDACRRLGVVSIKDFLRCSPSRLLATRGIGPGTYRQAIRAIRQVLAQPPASPMPAGRALADTLAAMNDIERQVAAERISLPATGGRLRAVHMASRVGCPKEALVKIERHVRRRLRNALERRAAASWHEFLRELDRRGVIFAGSRVGPWRVTAEEIRLLAGLLPQRLTHVETARSGVAAMGLSRSRWRWLLRRVRRDAATVREVIPELAQRWSVPASTVTALVDGLTGQARFMPALQPRRAAARAPDLLEAIRACLGASPEPLHYRDIAQRAAAMQVAEPAGATRGDVTRRVARLLGQRPEFLRVARGTYLWEGSLAQAGYDTAELADGLHQILRRLDVPASPAALSERLPAAPGTDSRIPPAVILRTAGRDARFWVGGRAGEPLVGLGSVPGEATRHGHGRLLFRLLQEAGTPLSAEELAQRLQRHRVVTRREIERALAANARIAVLRARGKRLWVVSASSGKC